MTLSLLERQANQCKDFEDVIELAHKKTKQACIDLNIEMTNENDFIGSHHPNEIILTQRAQLIYNHFVAVIKRMAEIQ